MTPFLSPGYVYALRPGFWVFFSEISREECERFKLPVSLGMMVRHGDALDGYSTLVPGDTILVASDTGFPLVYSKHNPTTPAVLMVYPEMPYEDLRPRDVLLEAFERWEVSEEK